MPNTRERETVRALVSAFNVNNYDFDAVKTNFKLQSKGKKDYIVVSFEKSMDMYQCRGYLDSIKRKIIREFYGIEESNDAEILDAAKLIFDVNSFPFYISDRDWSWDKQHGFKFVTPVDKGVIFNLKSHLASSLKKDVIEDMPTRSVLTNAFNKKKYLWRGEFGNKGLLKQFESEFLSRMENRYENVPKKPLEVKGNSVHIKDVFDDARFIDSITRFTAWRIGIDLGVGNDVDRSVVLFKDSIINSVYQSTRIVVVGFVCASPLNREEASILIPLVLGGGGKRILTSEEALKLNRAFDGAVFYNLYDRTQGELSIDKSDGMYSIDFSNPEISHCVITKIMESSVINKDHELFVDPELRFPALSRSPSTELSDMNWESPTRSQGEVEDSPRQGSEKEEGEEGPRLLNYVNSVRTSDRPLTDLSYATTSCGVPGISRDLSAVQNVQAGTSAWTQQPNRWPLPAPSAGLLLWQTSRTSSSEGAGESMRTGKSIGCASSSHSPGVEDVNDVEPEKQQVSGECSEANSQESESPKKHGGGLKSKVKSFFSLNSKPKQHEASLKRCDVGHGTTRSVLAISVTKKPPVSKSSLSFPIRIKAKSNPSSAVTSPTHEGASGGLKPLTSDERKELRLFLSPELQKKLDSNSFSPREERLLYLTHTPEGKKELGGFLCEGKESQLLRLTGAQLSSPDNSSSKEVDRDSGFCSMGSPAAQHKGSVPSELKHPQQVKHTSEALGK